MAALEERIVQRLEAFSDIVIGFSLAQLGASIVLNKSMILDPTGLFTFFASFTIVCSLWFFHYRLFQNFFVAKGLPIVLNFLWLAVVVLLVFVSVHSSESGFENRNLTLLYFELYAVAYGILVIQTVLGISQREDAAPALRRKAQENVTHMGFWMLVFVACIVEIRMLPWSGGIGTFIGRTFLVAGVGSALLSAYLRRSSEGTLRFRPPSR